MLLDVGNDLPGIGLVPTTVEVFGNRTELDDEVARKVPWLGLAAFLASEADQRVFIIPHNDPGVRAPQKISAAFPLKLCAHIGLHK